MIEFELRYLFIESKEESCSLSKEVFDSKVTFRSSSESNEESRDSSESDKNLRSHHRYFVRVVRKHQQDMLDAQDLNQT